MAIKFDCEHCGKSLTTSDEKAGRKAKCPGCGEQIEVPQFDAIAEADYADDDEPDDDNLPAAPPRVIKKASVATKTCPMCGAKNARLAASCTACGERFEEFEEAERPKRLKRSEYDYAGFWLRFAAYIVDSIIVGCGGAFVGGVAGFVIALSLIAGNGGNPDIVDEPGMELIFNLIGQALGLLIGWLYFALMESSAKQATLGKMAVGIQVCDLDGRRISFGRASGRFFAKILSGLICLVGYIMAGFTEQKQALHDILAGTLVVRD